MKRIFFIIDNKKKYAGTSISGYKKKILMKAFETSILSNNYYNALYFGMEAIASGYFKDFWLVAFTILSEYIHVLSPNLPRQFIDRYKRFKEIEKKLRKKKVNLLEMRNILEIQKFVVFIIKNLIECKKKHSSFFIKPIYNNQRKLIVRDIKKLTPLFKRLKLLMNTVTNNKITYKGNTEATLIEIFNLMGQLLSVDCDSAMNMAHPHNINLYHHTRSQINEQIVGVFWNILIKIAKINQNIFTQISALYDIYNSKLMQKLEKESYILLNALYYFVYNINDEPVIGITKGDIMFVQRFYINIQKALNTETEREDFMKIEDKNKKKSKRGGKKSKKSVKKRNQLLLKNRQKNISQPNIKMYEVKPTIPIQKLIQENNNSVGKPINPTEMINNMEHKQSLKKQTDDFTEYEDDPFFKSLIEQEKEEEHNPKKKEIDIVIGNGDSIEDEYMNFLFDFEDLPTVEESRMNQTRTNHKKEKARTIKMPAKFNPVKSMKRDGIINKI